MKDMDQLEEIIASYGIKPQEIERLDGYSSINYRVKSEGINQLIKHYMDISEYEFISEEDRLLKLLSSKGLPFQLPVSRHDMKSLENGSFSRLLPFIEGDLLSSVEQTDSLLRSFGEAVGHLNYYLLSEKSNIIKSRELFWDLKHALVNAPKASYIKNPNDRKLVTYFLDLFEQNVFPIQSELRHGIIHSDLNDNNVIIEGEKVNGIIDFGDMAYSPLIYEVAIALTYIMLSNESDPFQKAEVFLQSYHSVLPLKKKEIALLGILIPTRLCVSVCNSAKKKAEDEDSEYVLISEKPAWTLLHKWISINPIWINNFFLKALDLTSAPLDVEVIKSKREKFTGKSLITSYDEPIYMTGGAFQYMYDEMGNTYLDAYNNISHVGHCHPNLSKVISKQVRKLNTNTRYLYPELAAYAEKLTSTLPSLLLKIFYVNSGSAASDLAIRMSTTHTERKTVAILENGYHGNTQIGIAISDYKHNGKGGSGKPKNIITLPLPNAFNQRFEKGEAYAYEAIELLSTEIEKGNAPSALIAEPISGCGGQVPLAAGYLKTLKPFLEANNILLIMDEVQTGFGRLGNYFWGFEMHNVVPDIMIMGKPMGNGHPVAAVVTTNKIAESFSNGMEFFTSFGGNPVSCSVAAEVLNVILEENLQDNAKRVGEFLKLGLNDLMESSDLIKDIRGEGLFLGIEFSKKETASFIKEELKRRFILVGTDGPLNNVIKIKPPLCFNTDNAKHFLIQIRESIKLYDLSKK